jgi:hypothetical protein
MGLARRPGLSLVCADGEIVHGGARQHGETRCLPDRHRAWLRRRAAHARQGRPAVGPASARTVVHRGVQNRPLGAALAGDAAVVAAPEVAVQQRRPDLRRSGAERAWRASRASFSPPGSLCRRLLCSCFVLRRVHLSARSGCTTYRVFFSPNMSTCRQGCMCKQLYTVYKAF